ILRKDDVAAKQIERAMEFVEKTDEGAFAPLTRQPIMKAILLPCTAYGSLSLVGFFSVFGF
ncbi:MAG TPA: hypothetical protein VH105_14975, partial [Burkholderiales bacterium]|nr:hypothetical protein [Burkholderiales bacterium]